MKNFRDLTIGKKITLILMGTSLGSFVIALILFTGLALYKAKESYIKDLQSTVKILAENCQEIMDFGIYEDAQKILNSLRERHSILSATIFDSSGKKFAEFKRPTWGEDEPFYLVPEYILPRAPLRVCSKIKIEERPLGKLCIEDNLEEIRALFSYYIFGIIGLTLFSLFGIYAISKRLQNLISTPITELTDALKHVSEKKDFSIRIDTDRKDEIGQLVNAFNYMLDQIEARDNQIRASAKRYKALFESANDAIFILHENSIIHFNLKAEQMFGYAQDELIGRPFESLFSSSSPIIMAANPTNAPMNFEIECIKKDGSTFFGEINITTVTVEGEEPLFQVFIRDISERKAYEEELSRLALALEHAAEDIMITDANGIIQYVNPAFEKITGYSRSEALGRNPRFLKSGNHDEAFYREFWDTIKSGRIWKGKFVNKRKDGAIIEEEATVSPIITSNGDIKGFVAIKRDVTQQVKLEKHLRQAQKMEAIGTLAGGIAHDFNNILAGIFGYTEIALHNLHDPNKVKSNLENLLKAAVRAKELVAQILTFSRAKETEPQPLHIKPIVKECLKLLKASLPKHIEIRDEILSDAMVFSDPVHIHQMIMNLCTNATHAIQESNGCILLRIEDECLEGDVKNIHPEARPGDYCKITVSDNGCGMPPEILDHIFEPFFTTKEEGKGTGLGLSIVHGIVKQAGGFILVKSEVGKGSTFEIFLPRLHHTQNTFVEKVAGPPRGLGEKVLVIDDEQSITHLAEEMLTMLGYKVVITNDGISGLEMLRDPNGDFDLVITDLSMPHITGVQIAQEVQNMGKKIPVILCSGFTANLGEQSLRELGVKKILKKPFTMDVLARIIREVLDNYNNEQDSESSSGRFDGAEEG